MPQTKSKRWNRNGIDAEKVREEVASGRFDPFNYRAVDIYNSRDCFKENYILSNFTKNIKPIAGEFKRSNPEVRPTSSKCASFLYYNIF